MRTFLSSALAVWLLLPVRLFGAFGITSSGGFYTVDTGAGLVFMVEQSNGDITSLKFNGTEYQATDKHSQISSGLGSAVVSTNIYGTNFIKITCVCTDTNEVPSTNTPLTHYLMARNGYPIIYMATFVTSPSQPSVNSAGSPASSLTEIPNGPPQSNSITAIFWRHRKH